MAKRRVRVELNSPIAGLETGRAAKTKLNGNIVMNVAGYLSKNKAYARTCHPDRSEAKWSDLRFQSAPTKNRGCPILRVLCEGWDSGMLLQRESGCPRCAKLTWVSKSVIPTEAQRSGGTRVYPSSFTAKICPQPTARSTIYILQDIVAPDFSGSRGEQQERKAAPDPWQQQR